MFLQCVHVCVCVCVCVCMLMSVCLMYVNCTLREEETAARRARCVWYMCIYNMYVCTYDGISVATGGVRIN